MHCVGRRWNFLILNLVLHVISTRPERLDLLKIFGECFTNFSQPIMVILGRTMYLFLSRYIDENYTTKMPTSLCFFAKVYGIWKHLCRRSSY
jgi:hypothetical protein